MKLAIINVFKDGRDWATDFKMASVSMPIKFTYLTAVCHTLFFGNQF